MGALEVQQKEAFRQHCKLYYQKSLSTSWANENVTEESHGGNNKNDLELSKLILDAYEHSLSCKHNALHTENGISNNVELNKFLNSQLAEKYMNEIQSCGLLLTSNNQDNHDYKEGKNSRYLPIEQQQLIEYTTVKNEERRIAHVLQMKARSNILKSILQEVETLRTQTQSNNASTLIGEYDVTTQQYLTSTRTRIHNFVRQYKSNLGTHSLLGGMRALIETQIESGETICLWNFNASVISEACFGNNIEEGQGGDDNYMKNAISTLCSFLIFYQDDYFDVESSHIKNRLEEEEETLKFYIHPLLSDIYLKSIMALFPSSLDAKPTGNIYVEGLSLGNKYERQDGDDNFVRKNVLGKRDEPIFSFSLQQWTNSFCDIL